MVAPAAARHAERGQTLPIWTLAVLTALTLMFLSLNYANTIRWQVRAQNAADAAATAALTVQATQWNKMTAVLYAADIEEWRIRHVLQGMIDAGNGNGGCSLSGGTCLAIYGSLKAQYNRAVNRYTTDVQMLASMASYGLSAQSADATKIIQKLNATCGSPLVLADCSFTYHIIDYSYRTTTEQAGKDAFYLQLGGFTSPQDSTPVADWEPAQLEIATCATIQPLINFSIFGFGPKPFTVIGRSAATNVTETAEWFAPGVTQNPANGNAFFQPAENYNPTYDTFTSSASPRDWYQTTYPAIDYTAYPSVNNYNGPIDSDFEVMAVWWAAIPELPYTTAPQNQKTLCTQT
jgi:hypothetical protein